MTPEPLDESLASWLEGYEQRRRSGLSVNEAAALDVGPDMEEPVGQLREALGLLERVWPEHAEAQSTPAGGATVGMGGAVRPGGDFPRIAGYEIVGRIGHGGMGVVYRARQTHGLRREVALKVLPPAYSGNPERLRRFRHEAAVASRLTDSRVLPVFDLVEADAGPVLVMPYVAGSNLNRIITDRLAVKDGAAPEGRHPWALLPDADYVEQVNRLIGRVAEALVVAHGADVLHRDVKPANILVDDNGNIWLADFGLARLGPSDGLTCPGTPLGTPGFMSPEQWASGEDVDGRADVFGLAATAYQALTLTLPLGARPLTTKTKPALPPSSLEPCLSAGVDTVLLRALALDRRDRYPTARAFCDDWARARRHETPMARRPRRRPRVWPWAAGLFLAAAGLLAAVALPDRRPAALPTALRPVRLTTNPEGARVVFVPLLEYDGQPIPEDRLALPAHQRTPVECDLLPGRYLIEVVLDDGRFHEVYRTVPGPDDRIPGGPYWHDNWLRLPDGRIDLPAVTIPGREVTQSMVRLAGGVITRPEVRRIDPIPDYFLDSHEVTVGEYWRAMKTLPPPLHAVGPPPDKQAVGCVTFDEAVQYAERAGKRLPTEWEYELAATNGGTTRYPWGDRPADRPDRLWGPFTVGVVSFDRTTTDPPVWGLYSNVGEWVYGLYDAPPDVPREFLPSISPHCRNVRGAPRSALLGQLLDRDLHQGVTFRQGENRLDRHVALGFRAARSATPRDRPP